MRREITRFANIMETKLDENESKGGWQNDAAVVLWGRALEELTELYWVLLENPESSTKIGKECADVANFMMMISDIRGALD